MKIHQYNEMMRWLTRPKEDPSIKQLAASLPYGTQETYGAPEQIDMPNIQEKVNTEVVNFHRRMDQENQGIRVLFLNPNLGMRQLIYF